MDIETIIGLRRRLHECAEVSGREIKTIAMLEAFLHENTDLEIKACGDGFYAAHREEKTEKPAIVLRADYDALALPSGGAAHLCGHDGHAAALCGAAAEVDGKRLGRNAFFLFQPAEETGGGAKGCCEIFEMEEVGEIYGAHNLPGRRMGQILTRRGTFACGSLGLAVRFTGQATHAAYPENGISPAGAVGRLLCAVEDVSQLEKFSAMTLCTVIGVNMGEKAFGAAAAAAEIWLTLRAERESDLERLKEKIKAVARQIGTERRLETNFEEQDVFPATENHGESAEKLLSLGAAELEEPMRWSEDFGHYLMKCRGAYFGIGAGESCPALHTSEYVYPDALLAPTINTFIKLLKS